MSLNLDARQRAMLQDMGITVWAPRTAATPAPALAESAAATPAAQAGQAVTAAPVSTPAAKALAPAPAVSVPAEAKASAPNRAPTQEIPATAAPDSGAADTSTASSTGPASGHAPAYRAPAATTAPWFMAPLVHAYADTAAAQAPDAGWLVAVECADPRDPWAGEAGTLLNNMLHALRLQLHPQVRIAPLTRHAPAEGADTDLEPLAPALQAAITQHHPARVLVLGLHAARAVLQRTEALGPLRAEVHQLHGVPAVVSYDPAYLLRAVLQRTEALGPLRAEVHQFHGVPAVVSYDPAYLLRAAHAKPGAWADLCRAHSLQPPAA